MSHQPNKGIELDAPSQGNLQWPTDAVMIVASRVGTENRAAMEGVVSATCRNCDAELAADTRTVRTAEHLPERNGRPVMFFCVECAINHDRNVIDLIVDQREGRDNYIRKEQA